MTWSNVKALGDEIGNRLSKIHRGGVLEWRDGQVEANSATLRKLIEEARSAVLAEVTDTAGQALEANALRLMATWIDDAETDIATRQVSVRFASVEREGVLASIAQGLEIIAVSGEHGSGQAYMSYYKLMVIRYGDEVPIGLQSPMMRREISAYSDTYTKDDALQKVREFEPHGIVVFAYARPFLRAEH